MKPILLVAAVLVSGCAMPAVSPQMPPQSVHRARPLTASGPQLYVAECCAVLNTGDVALYSPGEQQVQQRYINFAHFPAQIAVDATGTLYVRNLSNVGPGGVAITEWDRGSKQPSRRLGPFYWATAFALDSADEVYVANCNTCVYSSAHPRTSAPKDSITIYQAKGTQLLQTITDGIYQPLSLAFDQQQNLYVFNGGYHRHAPSITVYAPGASTPTLTITQNIQQTGVLGFDPAGRLYVADGRKRVLEFAPDSDQVLRTITSGISSPQALQFGRYNRLYVANWPPSGDGWISVYPPGSSSPKYQIKDSIKYPVAMAVDSSQNLYVANLGDYGNSWVSVYEPSDGALIMTIKGGKYGPPRALAFGTP